MRMSPGSALELPSFRQQNLLVEFASLKHIQLQGIYVSLIQGDPSLWHGVLFVRKGPYAPAILRFRISFATGYPLAPPTLSFASDPFHPLITPLTTASYSTRLSEDDYDRTNAEQKLPPGGFSLKHGFPHWFQKKPGESNASRPIQTPESGGTAEQRTSVLSEWDVKESQITNQVHVVDVLRYVRSSFEEEDIIDAIPTDAAGNPGAWYAWRAYRNKIHKKSSKLAPEQAAVGETPGHRHQQDATFGGPAQTTPNRPRGPSEWNWEGVWEERVKKVVQSSLSEPNLFGGGPTRDDEIHFVNYEPEEVGEIHTEMRRHLRIPD